MRRVVIALLLLWTCHVSLAVPSAAQTAGAGERWIRIGALELDRLASQDSLEIDEPATVYKAIRLEARQADIVISRVQVVWQGAPLHTEDRTIDLRIGERTRPMATLDAPRPVARVGVIYRAGGAPSSPKPIVEVWGLRASGGGGSPSAGARSGEVVLATRSIAFNTGRVVLPVRSDAGAFARIGVRASGIDVFVEELRIVHTDADPETVPVVSNIPIGSPIRWLDLKAGRPIKEIEVVYKSRPGFKGQARLEIVGDGSDDPARSTGFTPVPPDRPSLKRSVRGGSVARTVVLPDPSTACITETTCTPVPIFFGTNRERKEEGGRILFTQNRNTEATLGQATVTVPRAYRKKGEIPRPSWWDLTRFANPYKEDPTRHFMILYSATKVYGSEDEFVAAVKAAMAEPGAYKDHAFVFVHGYNVSFEHALYRTAQIAYDLGHDDMPFGTAFLFSWPSAGEIESYVYDLESAEKAVAHVERFVDLVVAKTGARHVHLIAHSMGNAPLLAALSNLAARGAARSNINQVILAAPDVDAKDFAQLASQILPLAQTLTLYASSQDRAIQASRKLRRDLARAGDVIDGQPVIVSGLDTIDVSTISTGILSLNHTAYADKKELLNDMRRLMLTGERPPDVRDISIRKVTDRTGTFWRFVK